MSLGALNVTLGGDLRVTKAAGQRSRWSGRSIPSVGTYDFQGRRFQVLRDGTITLPRRDADEIDPASTCRTRLIRASRRTSRSAAAAGAGDRAPSQPPLDQADILSLIVFNQPTNSLGEGQQVSLVQRAQQLATGTLTSALASSIEKSLGVDTFEINTAPDSGNAASLTIGQQLGQNIYVKVQQGIGSQSETNFIFEYELARWLRCGPTCSRAPTPSSSCSSERRAAASTCCSSSATEIIEICSSPRPRREAPPDAKPAARFPLPTDRPSEFDAPVPRPTPAPPPAPTPAPSSAPPHRRCPLRRRARPAARCRSRTGPNLPPVRSP